MLRKKITQNNSDRLKLRFLEFPWRSDIFGLINKLKISLKKKPGLAE